MDILELINLPLSLNRQAEDIRRDEELQSASHHVLTLDGEVMAVNGKLLAGHMPISNDTDDCVSVCSCTCLGATNSELLDSSGYQGYRPPSITKTSLRVKRASVWWREFRRRSSLRRRLSRADSRELLGIDV